LLRRYDLSDRNKFQKSIILAGKSVALHAGNLVIFPYEILIKSIQLPVSVTCLEQGCLFWHIVFVLSAPTELFQVYFAFGIKDHAFGFEQRTLPFRAGALLILPCELMTRCQGTSSGQFAIAPPTQRGANAT
jgi:hypothetical protein